jgi:hypothetical protein
MSDLIPIRLAEQACANLQAEIDRLRAAGDAMQKSMLECGPNETAKAFHHDAWWAAYYGWNAAKEGKQP